MADGTKRTTLRNINQKLTVFVGGSIALALTILGFIAVSYSSDLATEKVHGEVFRMLEANALEVKGFFAERAKIVTTVLGDPRLEAYFTGYREYRAPITDDREIKEIIDYFDVIAAEDTRRTATLLSAIAGLHEPQAGRLDVPARAHDRHRIAYVLQTTKVNDQTAITAKTITA